MLINIVVRCNGKSLGVKGVCLRLRGRGPAATTAAAPTIPASRFQGVMTTKVGETDAESDALEDADYQALGDFRRAIREFLAFSAEGAKANGLTSQQHQALLAIRTHQGAEAMSVGELAACLLIKNHSAIGLTARAGVRPALGIVCRSARALVELTPAGALALQSISIRNLGQLNRESRTLEGVLKTTRKLSRRPAAE